MKIKMRKSFREIANFIHPVSPANTLRTLGNEHRRLDKNEEISFRDIFNRHNKSNTKVVRFLCYNTWLLHAPFGNSKPVIPYRAYLMGLEFKNSGYDIAVLTEVFDKDDATLIKKKSGIKWARSGHDGSFTESGGGLYTLSNLTITDSGKHEFDEDGGWGIIDSWAEKGILWTEMDMGIGKIDLYTTHLVYGSKTTEEVVGADVEKLAVEISTPIVVNREKERSKLRLAQVRELREFISKTHKPRNIAIIAGDFNIGANQNLNGFRPYQKMMNLLSDIPLHDGTKTTFEDLWTTKGDTLGATNNSYTKCKKRYGDGTIFCDDSGNAENGRIDYVFIEQPTKEHNFTVDTTVIRRRPFPLPTLNLNEIIRMLAECGINTELQKEMRKHTKKIPAVEISPLGSRLDLDETSALITMLHEEFDFENIFNTWLIKKCRQNKGDRFGHLSDHIGLDFTLIASR